MAIITVNKLTVVGARMEIRLHTSAIVLHYASADGVAVHLANGEALQLVETLDEFERLLDGAPKAPKPKPSKGKATPEDTEEPSAADGAE